MTRRKKKPIQDQNEREVITFYEKLDRELEAAALANPKLGAFLEEAKQKRKTVDCKELMKMVEKARLFRDKIYRNIESDWNLANYIHGILLEDLHERCPKQWQIYADKQLPKIAQEMREVKEYKKIEPLKKSGGFTG